MVAIAQLEFHVPAPHPLRQAVVLGKPHLGLQQPDLANKYGFEQVDKPKLQSSESVFISSEFPVLAQPHLSPPQALQPRL